MFSTKIKLPGVALCAIDTANVSLTIRALKKCLAVFEFADAFILTHQEVKAPCRVEIIAPLTSRGAYSQFILKDLVAYIKTPHILLVQWDGYIINPEAWTPDFLNYDYIGAKWSWVKPDQNVGNGGFSLRSRKLMEAVASLPTLPPEDYLEDQQICRYLRPPLEKKYNIKFAPESIADLFSYEYDQPVGTPFGFHGLFNMWRYLDDHELESVLNQVADYVIISHPYLRLFEQYFWLNSVSPMRIIYKRIRKLLNKEELHAQWQELLGRTEPKLMDLIIAGEALLDKDGAIKR